MHRLTQLFSSKSGLDWTEVRWLARPARNQIVLVALLSVAGALVEAGALVLLLNLAIGVTDSAGAVEPLPLLGWAPTSAQLLFLILVLSALRLLTQSASSWLAAGAVSRRTVDLRDDLHRAYMSADWRTQHQLDQGAFQDLVTTQSSRGSSLLTAMFVGLSSFLNLATFTISAMIVTPLAAVFILFGVALLYLVLRPVSELARRVAGAHSAAAAAYGSTVNESVALHQEVRTFGVRQEEIGRVSDAARAIQRHQRRSIFIARSLPGVYQSVAIALLATAIYASAQVTTFEPEVAGATLILLLRAFGHSQKLQSVYNDLNDRAPYVRRVRQAVDSFQSGATLFGDATVSQVESLEFDNVSVFHDEHRALIDISFRIDRGEVVGIVGPSGSGKTTLLRTLGRLLEVDDGKYLINGIDAASISETFFTGQFATVSQEPRLLDGSMADNVRFLRDLPLDQVEAALEAASLTEEVASLEQGLDTTIGERGRTISGGQKQRVSLARSLASNPNVLLLDEPTSALDESSEQRIHDAIELLRHDAIVVIVSHRRTTLELCDRVIAISGGKIVARGSIAETLNADPSLKTELE